MGLGSILVLLVLVGSLIGFIYIIVQTARGWGALHTTLLCFLFIECWVFIVMAAGVQATRVKFTKDADTQQKRAEAAAEQTAQLLWGQFDPNSAEYTAVIPAKNALKRATSDRGRVWRNVTLTSQSDDSFQLELSAADAVANDDLGADPADAGALQAFTSESLPVDLVVYAFAEEPNTEGQPIPKFYLGEHTVTQTQDLFVTVEPTLPLSDAQKTFLAGGGGTSWTLYEMLPTDSHKAFAAVGSGATDEAIFGRMDEQTIRDLFADVPEADGRQERLVESYLRDGQKANDDDAAESVWAKVIMTQNHEVDVDSQEDANMTERGYFDSSGRGIDARLKRASAGQSGIVTLSPNITERIVLKESEATNLVNSGKAQIDYRIFVRPLNDYEQAFNNHAIRMHDVAERIATYERETKKLQASNSTGQEIISFEQVEQGKLESDLQNYSKELEAANAALSDTKSELAKMRAELSQMFRLIRANSPSRP